MQRQVSRELQEMTPTVKPNFPADTDAFRIYCQRLFVTISMGKGLGPWDTTAALANGSGLPVYGKVVLEGWIRNSPISMEFLESQIIDNGIL